MFNFKISNSKSLTLIIGILMSVIIYYIYHFFSLLGLIIKFHPMLQYGSNLILILTCMIGIVNINEK